MDTSKCSHERRFTCAISTKDSQALPLVKIETDVFQGPEPVLTCKVDFSFAVIEESDVSSLDSELFGVHSVRVDTPQLAARLLM